MRITELPNNNKLHVPQTHRNRIISASIKEPCINTNSTTIFSAKPNSGKSLCVQSFLRRKCQYRKAFTHVYVVAPSGSRKSFKNCVFQDHPEEKLFDELNDDTLDTLENALQEVNDEDDEDQAAAPQYTLWIFDDVQAALKQNRQFENRLKNIFCSYRHRNLSIWVLVQSWKAVPKQIRDCVRAVYQWNPASLREIETFHDEVLPHLTKQQIKELFKHVYRKPHDFLFVDRQENKLARNMTPLLIDTAEDGAPESTPRLATRSKSGGKRVLNFGNADDSKS